MLKPSLSVRCAESPKRKDVSSIPFEQLVAYAAGAGFRALCLRASVVGVDSPRSKVVKIRSILDQYALQVSMVTGDTALASNNDEATRAIQHIEPYLQLASELGAAAVRVMAHRSSDIDALRRSADLASTYGLTLLHQTHWGSLCETVQDSVALVQAVDRENFGITLDPGNLLACTGEALPSNLSELASVLGNVYFQNLRLDPSSAISFPSLRRGVVGVRYVALNDRSGIDVAALTRWLRNVGYNGWFTIHQPLRDRQEVREAIDEAARVVRQVIKNYG